MRDSTRAANSPMREFYQGKTVFLTGGTGFLGKLFIEKLLRCEVREVVLLVRAKRGRAPRERIELQLEREAIYISYAQNPESYWSRLRIMEGSLDCDKLNLSEIDIDYLQENVNIVIHSAADVSLDVSLKASIKTNVFGTDELLKIALHMKQLQSFLYISTAYSNCTQDVVYEKFYDVNIDPITIVQVAELSDEGQMDALSRNIIHPWPNTYTYGKANAENVVRAYSRRLPVAVIRPSIVTSTVEDPIEGWTDNVYGINGIVVSFATGVLRTQHAFKDYQLDIIPADLVINSSLAVIWYTATQQSQIPPDGNVFNCTNHLDNPITYQNAYDYFALIAKEIPVMQMLWYPNFNPIRSASIYYVLHLLFHIIPALLFDMFTKLNGKKPRILNIYRKLQTFMGVAQFFAIHEWTFVNDRMRQVYNSMTPDDKKYFLSDVKTITWLDYFNTYIPGVRKYILRESMDNLKQARSRFLKLKVAHYMILGLMYLTMTYLAYIAFRSSLMKHGLERIEM